MEDGFRLASAVDTLQPSIAKVLLTAVHAARLTTLQLVVCEMPELSTLARGQTAASELTLWPTTVAPSGWHDGLVLLAVAPQATPFARSTVEDAAGLISDLVSADRRRVQAELLATHAVELAGMDSLTHLGNRRAWERALEEESARATRYKADTSIAIVDLDGLKGINDSAGHAAGDAHLLLAAEAIKAGSRSVDVVCRLGGDEFAVLAPETGVDGAERLVGRLHRSMADAGVRASIGVATAHGGCLQRTWQEADAEMYRNKKQQALVPVAR